MEGYGGGVLLGSTTELENEDINIGLGSYHLVVILLPLSLKCVVNTT